jgi:bacteriocin resistance YdeI/OmpD-like protein/uncharacterized protein DUF1905
MNSQHFETMVEARRGGGVAIRLPFDPAAEWGDRDRWHVEGTIGGNRFRGTISPLDSGHAVLLGPTWCRDPRVGAGRHVEVIMQPEAPDSTTVAADFASTLGTEPAARRFFDSLPTFYRKNYVRWVEEAKRPETRQRRIAQAVVDLKEGREEHSPSR